MTDPPTEIPELPADRWIGRLVSLLEPVSRVTRLRLYGVEHLPADGSLLVGNHTIYGFLDLPFLMAEIWKHRRLAVRGLGRTLERTPSVTAARRSARARGAGWPAPAGEGRGMTLSRRGSDELRARPDLKGAL